MNRFLRAALIVLTVIMSQAIAAKTPGEKVGAAFSSLICDFGTISEDDPAVVHEFNYTNTGTAPLAILSAKPSCGCTTPDYSRQPLMPGKSAKIKVSFIPKGKAGEVNNDVKVKFKNANGRSEQVTLRFIGVVVPARKNK